MYDVAIIGAGASGLFCASLLNSPKTAVFELNAKPAKKLSISGGGKCNITNKYLCSNFYQGKKEFLDNCFQCFDNSALLQYLKDNNITYKLQPKIVKGTYFLNSSKEIINNLLVKSNKCRYYFDNSVTDVEYKDGLFHIHTQKTSFEAKKLIVASGGISYPSLGISDLGYKIATKFGHTIEPLNPALVGFTVQKEQFWFKELSGLSVQVTIKVGDKSLEGSLLFTHKGISGPVVLSTSLYWQKGRVSIDFLPNLDLSALKGSKQVLSNVLQLPKRFTKAFLTHLGLKDKPYDQYTKKEQELLCLIHEYSFAPAGNFGYSKAEVTKGGISTDEITNTFESKKQKGLYFIGELLNVTGELGGYNLQWAFTSAYITALNLKKTLQIK